MSGKDKGKEGKVLEAFPAEGKITVEGLNLVVKHMRPRRSGEKGQRIQFPAPLRVSNVMLICSKCNKLTRVGYKILENGKKVRMCKKCKEVIE
ncbi:MAG: 50S ribosomal protein L24 [Patescibacteria group bacterium]